MKIHEDNEMDMIKKLESLRPTSPRNPLRAQSGRARFLNEAANIEIPVSPEAKKRHKKYRNGFLDGFLLTRREGKPMINLLTTTIVILTLIFGGGGFH
jgi:hypothetical protein